MYTQNFCHLCWQLCPKTEYSRAQGVEKLVIRNFDSVSVWNQITITADTANILKIDDKEVIVFCTYSRSELIDVCWEK